VVATIDKDLDQIEGEHWDYMKHVSYAVSSWTATFWFYKQILTGEQTDNIPGCYKCGPIKADKLLADAYTEKDLWHEVLRAYHSAAALPNYPWGDKDPADIALEQARLVYLQREEGELWSPPGEDKQWLE
jgi:hypothetical protein